MEKQSQIDIYTLVNNRIIYLLEQGEIPWRQPWKDSGLPMNLITGKPYRGINIWLLNSLNFKQNYFLTYNQVKELGGSVKKDEKSQMVVFWKWIEYDSKTNPDEKEKIPLLRYYRVFNISQCEGIPEKKIPEVDENKNNPIEICEKIIKEMTNRPSIKFDRNEAFYSQKHDYINIPELKKFDRSEDYYSTLFHELVHSTGHSSRLNRSELVQSKGFGSENYAIEELTAEMGASYLKNTAGIPIEQLENNAAYIQNWLNVLKKDKRFIFYASSQAQKATDYILSAKNDEKIKAIDQAEYANRETKLIKTREKNNKNSPCLEI